jgi:taurine dioxygenase
MSLAIEAVSIRPLSPVLGAEVTGIDLSCPLDAATRQEIYDAFVRYQVLCFRGQRLSTEQQIAFSEQFGTLERHIARNRGADNPLVHTVSNLGPDGQPSGKVGSQEWHTDKSFRPEPSMATILHAITMPPNGGDTCFADMYAAYEALDGEEKAELDDVRVVHSWELSQQKHGRIATPEEIADAPPMIHPLVRVHPDSGRKCLFMGVHASHFDGVPMEAGRGAARGIGGACDSGEICVSARVAGRRCADVGQSLPAAPGGRELRGGTVSAGVAPDLPQGHRPLPLARSLHFV